METLDELRAAVHRDPRRVADAAVTVAAAARESQDPAQLSQILAVRGRALRSLGEIDLAETVLNESITVARQAGDDDLAADAHVALAGVLSFAGRADEAFEHLDLADGLGSSRVRAYALLQRAIINQRLGHLEQALAGYEAALPTLRDIDATTDLALVLMNRGVIRTQTADYAGAIKDLTESADYFAAGGNEFGIAQTRHGLGWAQARAGDLPTAMSFLDEAAARFRALGHEGLEVDVDRIETLLAAGLAAEAAQLGDDTAPHLAEAGNHSQAAEVWLLCARAALLDGDMDRCRTYASKARDVFSQQQSLGWELAARLELLRCEPTADPETLQTLAGELATEGNARGSAIALALASLAASRSGDLELAARLARDVEGRGHTAGVLEVRMIGTLAAAALALAGADHVGAAALVRQGLSDLQEHRSALAASDARAAVSAHAGALSSLGMSMAVGEGSAADLLEWIERSRGLRSPVVPARPAQDPEVAAELAELRSVGQELRAGEAAGRPTDELLERQRELERDIRRRELHARGWDDAGTGPPATVNELREDLGEQVLVVLAEVDGRLMAVRVEPARSVLLDLGATAPVVRGATATARLLRTALRSLGLGAENSAEASTGNPYAALRRSLGALDGLLCDALVGDRPLVLVVPPNLHAIPWGLLPSLTGRAFVLAPSATWWQRATATESAADSRAGQSVAGQSVAVAGPRLVEAAQEAIEIAACYPHGRAIVGAEATAAAVVTALGSAPLVHVASHMRVRHDNALWSCLELADGPLYVYDLEHERSTAPTVVLSGCETGVGVRAGAELVGLSTCLLERGTRRLVASVCELPDTTATRQLMTALHQRIARGEPPSAALAALASAWASASTERVESDPGVDHIDALIAGSVVSFGLH